MSIILAKMTCYIDLDLSSFVNCTKQMKYSSFLPRTLINHAIFDVSKLRLLRQMQISNNKFIDYYYLISYW